MNKPIIPLLEKQALHVDFGYWRNRPKSISESLEETVETFVRGQNPNNLLWSMVNKGPHYFTRGTHQ